MALDLWLRAIMAVLRPILRPYHFKQSLTYNNLVTNFNKNVMCIHSKLRHEQVACGIKDICHLIVKVHQ